MTRAKPKPGSKPAGTGSRPAGAAMAARLKAAELRQAESAAMMIAITRLLLNMRGRDFAAWLRFIADDFEATDPEAEDPDELGLELARQSGSRPDPEAPNGEDARLDEVLDEPPPGTPHRAH